MWNTPLPRRRLPLIAAAGLVAIIAGCNDLRQPTAVEESTAAPHDPWASMVWIASGSSLRYGGAASGEMQRIVTADGKSIVRFVDGHRGQPTVAEHAATATAFFGTESPPVAPGPHAARTGSRVRPSLNRPILELVGPNGEATGIQILEDADRSKPPKAVLIYDATRPVALVEYVYARAGGDKWRPVRAKTTHFDSTGTVLAVQATTYGKVTSGERMSSSMDGGPIAGATMAPDALSVYEDAGVVCATEHLKVALYTAALVAASAALTAAIVACPATLGIACPAVALATLAVALATFELQQAVEEMLACMRKATQCPGEDEFSALSTSDAVPPSTMALACDGGGGGGGGSSPITCYTITWEISYDGGVTWEYFDTEYVCTTNQT